jgi:hypothetical protein
MYKNFKEKKINNTMKIKKFNQLNENVELEKIETIKELEKLVDILEKLKPILFKLNNEESFDDTLGDYIQENWFNRLTDLFGDDSVIDEIESTINALKDEL